MTETHIWMLCGSRAQAASGSMSRQSNSAFAWLYRMCRDRIGNKKCENSGCHLMTCGLSGFSLQCWEDNEMFVLIDKVH